MAHSNGTITAPVTIKKRSEDDVLTVLDIGTQENVRVQNTLRSSKINQWARYKPSNGGCNFNRRKADGSKEKYSVLYGIADYDFEQCTSSSIYNRNRHYYILSDGNYVLVPNLSESTFNANKTNYYYKGNTLVGVEGIFKKLVATSLGDDNWSISFKWDFYKSKPYVCRLNDMNGYKHNATFGIEKETFFPAKTLGLQVGNFYNVSQNVVNIRSVRPGIPLPSYSTTEGTSNDMPQCWENAVSGQNIDSYGTLYLEDIVKASSIDAIATFQISNFKIGVALRKRNGTGSQSTVTARYVLNTGITFDTFINGSYAAGVAFNVRVGSDVINNVGTYDVGGGIARLNVIFDKLTPIVPTGYSDNIYLDARLVLIDTNDTACLYIGFPENSPTASYSMYPFEPLYIDGSTPDKYIYYKDKMTFKKAYSQVYVTEKTDLDSNRNPGTIRNNGRYFDGTAGITYSDTTNNWSSNHQVNFNKCSLDYDTNDFIYHQSTDASGKMIFVSGSATQSADNYYKFRLKLDGCCCWEFRPYTSMLSNPPLITEKPCVFIDDDDNVSKSIRMELVVPSSIDGTALSNVYLQVSDSNSYPVLLNKWNGSQSLDEYDGYEIGNGTESHGYSWSGRNHVTSGQLNGCDKNYGSSTGYYSKCHSALLTIDHLKYQRKNDGQIADATTQTDYVYIFVSAYGLTNYRNFYMQLKYSGIDTFGIMESFGNASSNKINTKDVTD